MANTTKHMKTGAAGSTGAAGGSAGAAARSAGAAARAREHDVLSDVERDMKRDVEFAQNKAAGIEEGLTYNAKRNTRFPLIMRIFGVLLILSGMANILTHLIIIFVVGASSIINRALKEFSTATLVIAFVYLAILFINAVMQVVLGIRLLRGKHRRVALAAKSMTLLQVAAIVCNMMLYGLSNEIYSYVVSIIILSTLEAYADPTLRREREERRRRKTLSDKADQKAGILGLDKTGKGYIELDFFNVFWIFFVCAVIGLVLEDIWHMCVVDPGVYEDRAGLLYGPFSPIYGFGGALVTVCLNRFWKSSPILQFLAAGAIGSTFEFCVSWWLEFSFGIVAWNYSGTFLNIDGRTNFMFFCMWGVLGIVWLRYILPRLLRLINRIPWYARYSLTSVVAALMIVNCGLTAASLDCWYQREAGTMATKEQSWLDKWCNTHYDNAFMAARFESMTIDASKAARMD